MLSFANGTAPPQPETSTETKSKGAFQPKSNDSRYADYIQKHPNHKFLSEQLYEDAHKYRRRHPNRVINDPSDVKIGSCKHCEGECTLAHRTLIALYLRIIDADRANR